MRIDVVSLFPDFVRQCAGIGVVGRAMERQLLEIAAWNPRDYALDNYRRVDDRPFGGGPGMVMLAEPLIASLEAARQSATGEARVVCLSPQGVPLTQAKVRELAALPRLILVCGRYEGFDERFLEQEVDEEISIGDYVLSGGELAAAVLIDAVGRLQPGALNDSESAAQDSFEDGLLDCPHYTRSERWGTDGVPPVLLSGDHARIARWRRQQSLGRTWLRRPDLLARMTLSPEDAQLLAQFQAEYRLRSEKPENP
jgi:tRNA (guanine37-N1)-methyltransferase